MLMSMLTIFDFCGARFRPCCPALPCHKKSQTTREKTTQATRQTCCAGSSPPSLSSLPAPLTMDRPRGPCPVVMSSCRHSVMRSGNAMRHVAIVQGSGGDGVRRIMHEEPPGTNQLQTEGRGRTEERRRRMCSTTTLMQTNNSISSRTCAGTQLQFVDHAISRGSLVVLGVQQ